MLAIAAAEMRYIGTEPAASSKRHTRAATAVRRRGALEDMIIGAKSTAVIVATLAEAQRGGNADPRRV
jgi:hypothetical protein